MPNQGAPPSLSRPTLKARLKAEGAAVRWTFRCESVSHLMRLSTSEGVVYGHVSRVIDFQASSIFAFHTARTAHLTHYVHFGISTFARSASGPAAARGPGPALLLYPRYRTVVRRGIARRAGGASCPPPLHPAGRYGMRGMRTHVRTARVRMNNLVRRSPQPAYTRKVQGRNTNTVRGTQRVLHITNINRLGRCPRAAPERRCDWGAQPHPSAATAWC